MKIHVAKDLNPGPITSAKYGAEITKMKPGLSKAKNPKIEVELTIITKGPNGDKEKTIGRKVFDNLTLTENALWKVGAAFKAVTGKDLPEGDYTCDELTNLITSAMTGKSVCVSLSLDQNEGYKPKNKVDSYAPMS